MKKTPSLRSLKTALLGVSQALDDPARVDLLLRLTKKPQNVESLAANASLSRPTISYHLGVLLRAGAVTMEKRGRESIYTADVAGLRTHFRTLVEMFDGLKR